MESEVRPSENAAKKNKANDQRKTEPAARPIRFYYIRCVGLLFLRLDEFKRSRVFLDDTFDAFASELGLGSLLSDGNVFFVVPTSSRPAFSSIGFRSTGFSMEAASF